MPMRIVVGGPRGCGKSTLVASMFSHLEATGANVGVHEIDVYSDTINCILGRKPWTERRKRVKAWFDPTIKRRIGEFVADQSRLVLGDLPGKITNPFLHKMVEPAHRAVIVAKDYEELEQWERFFTKQGIPVILRVMSCVHDRPSLPSDAPDMIFVYGLDRTVQRSAVVHSLADTLYAPVRPKLVPVRVLVPAE